MAYNELGEEKAAQKSLEYFAHFINHTYLATPNLVERLDLLDPSPTIIGPKSYQKLRQLF